MSEILNAAEKKLNGLLRLLCPRVILYALLVGRLPFEENTTEGLYRRIISGNFGCPSHVSPEACSLLRGILHTSPLKRLGPLQIKQHPWYEANGGSARAPAEGTQHPNVVSIRAIPPLPSYHKLLETKSPSVSATFVFLASAICAQVMRQQRLRADP